MDKWGMQQIFEDCGLDTIGYEPAHGGDINAAFRVRTSDGDYCLKVNDAKAYPAMYEKEVDGLKALRDNAGLVVPAVVNVRAVEGRQYLLLEWLEKGILRTDTWEDFGRKLGFMHQQPQAHFGWHTDNYIGSLQQTNRTCQAWDDFFATCRVLPLVKRLFDDGSFSRQDVLNAEQLCSWRDLFPKEFPSLLHGDLWSGNFMVTTNGDVAIYDPAVYCGHREMDIGMTMLFGGFDARFYKAYEEVYPLAAGWKERLPLSQLYPILVHAVLFNGHYTGKAREIIKLFR